MTELLFLPIFLMSSKNIIEKNKEYFMNEVLCTDIVANLKNFDYNSSFNYDNNEIEIYLKKH